MDREALAMDLRLNDLENFLSISDCPSLTEGARKLGISQPALSESLKRLESDLGCMLLYRTKSGIRLTPSGRMVRERGQRAHELLSGLLQIAGSEGATPGRSVRIGCHSAVASYVIPQALTILSSQAGMPRIELIHDVSRVLQAQIQNGTVDVGVLINAVPVPDLILRGVGSDVITVWKGPSGPTPPRVVCDPNLFQVQAILRRWPKAPSELITTANLELTAQLVSAGIGYGILPARVARRSPVALRTVRLAPSVHDHIALVHRPEFGRLPDERALLLALRTALRDSPRRPSRARSSALEPKR